MRVEQHRASLGHVLGRPTTKPLSQKRSLLLPALNSADPPLFTISSACITRPRILVSVSALRPGFGKNAAKSLHVFSQSTAECSFSTFPVHEVFKLGSIRLRRCIDFRVKSVHRSVTRSGSSPVCSHRLGGDRIGTERTR